MKFNKYKNQLKSDGNKEFFTGLVIGHIESLMNGGATLEADYYEYILKECLSVAKDLENHDEMK